MALIEPVFPRTRFTSPGIALAIQVRDYALSIDLNPSPELRCNSTSPKGEVKFARGPGSTLIMLS